MLRRSIHARSRICILMHPIVTTGVHAIVKRSYIVHSLVRHAIVSCATVAKTCLQAGPGSQNAALRQSSFQAVTMIRVRHHSSGAWRGRPPRALRFGPTGNIDSTTHPVVEDAGSGRVCGNLDRGLSGAERRNGGGRSTTTRSRERSTRTAGDRIAWRGAPASATRTGDAGGIHPIGAM